MSLIDYDQIRKENLMKYGTEVSHYGKVLLSEAYKERTHFFFELLQNAEDSCERKARKLSKNSAFYVVIELFTDRLEFRHNGDLFDLDDVRGVCGIVDTTKTKEHDMIGKFGIGFKSVYAFTNTPEIYSGKISFNITNYVFPHPIEMRRDLNVEETLIVIKFDKEDPDCLLSYNEIKSKLDELDYTTLLFLNRITKLSWKINEVTKVIERNQETIQEHCSKVKIVGPERAEEWLVFSNKDERGMPSLIRIAYRLGQNQEYKSVVIPVSGAKIYNYFQTDQVTNLKFHVDGSFHTTPARDNLRNDSWNFDLIDKAASLASESLEPLKELGYLSVDFLNLLPIDAEKAGEDSFIFAPFYTKIKEKLMNSNLLPGLDRYRSPKESVISRSEELRKLLSDKQLEMLTLKNINWLDTSITEDNYPILRDYLVKDLHVQLIDPTTFSDMVNNKFFLSQTDDWIVSFYSFLNNQRSLWDNSYRNPILRKKPIIRLYDNSHIEPFYEDGKPKANLPTDKLSSEQNHVFNTVKETLLKKEAAKQFLNDLGLKEVGRETVILNNVLPKYSHDPLEQNEVSNLRDLKWIAKTLADGSLIENASLIKEIKKFPILLAINAQSGIKTFKRPYEVFIPHSFSGSSDLEFFYEGNDKIWFLDEIYLKIPELDLDTLSLLGCKTAVELKFRKPDRNGYVELKNEYSNHKRGVDEFDPEASIVELSSILAKPNIKKAKIIWTLLGKHYKLISGTTETSRKATFYDTKKETSFSIFGKFLTEREWIPSKNDSFKRPGEIRMEDVAEVVYTGIQESPLIAEKLGIVDDNESKVLEKYPVMKQLLSLPSNKREKAVSVILKMLKEYQNYESNKDEGDDIGDIFKKHLDGKLPQNGINSEGKVWKSIPISEEEKIRENYGNSTSEKMNNSNFSTNPKVSKEYKNGNFDPRTFLKGEYDGRCQVCNTRLDLGDGRDPYFETYRIMKESRIPRASEGEFNVICLCPNCHALANHGGLALSEIYNSVSEILNGNKISEAVPERNGDFYVFRILLAGRSAELYYTQRHINQVISILNRADGNY